MFDGWPGVFLKHLWFVAADVDAAMARRSSVELGECDDPMVVLFLLM